MSANRIELQLEPKIYEEACCNNSNSNKIDADIGGVKKAEYDDERKQLRRKNGEEDLSNKISSGESTVGAFYDDGCEDVSSALRLHDQNSSLTSGKDYAIKKESYRVNNEVIIANNDNEHTSESISNNTKNKTKDRGFIGRKNRLIKEAEGAERILELSLLTNWKQQDDFENKTKINHENIVKDKINSGILSSQHVGKKKANEEGSKKKQKTQKKELSQRVNEIKIDSEKNECEQNGEKTPRKNINTDFDKNKERKEFEIDAGILGNEISEDSMYSKQNNSNNNNNNNKNIKTGIKNIKTTNKENNDHWNKNLNKVNKRSLFSISDNASNTTLDSTSFIKNPIKSSSKSNATASTFNAPNTSAITTQPTPSDNTFNNSGSTNNNNNNNNNTNNSNNNNNEKTLKYSRMKETCEPVDRLIHVAYQYNSNPSLKYFSAPCNIWPMLLSHFHAAF